MKRFSMRVFVFAVACLASLSMCRADELAAVTGLVTDPNGRSVPGVNILITNLATNVTSRTATNDQGIYRVPSLQPGIYRMTLDKDGFKSIVKSGVELHVQDVASINFELQIGSVNETVTVEAGGLVINTTDATVSTVVDRQFAENLPMNGRSFQTLIQLTPGVVLTPSNIADGGQFSVDGQRASANYWMVDGVSANIGISAVNVPGNGLGGALPSFSVLGGTNSLVSVDALQEFRIQTSTYAPEFGRTPGGQISIVTRSGANNFHGTAFDYLRNDILDANNWFNTSVTPALPKARDRQNDFGGTISGPILKDRTFFFFSYEGLRLRLPQTTFSIVPDVNARQNAIAAVQPFLNAFPIPNGPSSGADQAEFNASYSNPATLDAYSVRIDHKVGDKFNLFGRYNYSPSSLVLRGRGGLDTLSELTPNRITTQTATVGATWLVLPTLSNDLRFNYSRTNASSHFNLDNFGGAAPLTSLPFPTPFSGQNGQFLFFPAILGRVNPLRAGELAHNLQRQINVVDNLSLQRGSHSLKFGFDFRRLSPLYDPQSYSQFAFFLNVPSAEQGNALIGVIGGSRSGTLLFRNFGMFAQDTWRVIPRLTLTYGIRWDVDFAPSAISGPNLPAVTGFNLSNLSSLALATNGGPIFDTRYGNVAPRLGLAYRLSQNQDWGLVLRGGIGMFYDLATQEVGNSVSFSSYPFGAIKLSFGPTFPFDSSTATPPAITPANLSPGGGGTLYAFDPRLELPYALEWNIALEQALGKEQALSASYIGSVGRRLIQTAFVSNPNSNFGRTQLVTNTGTSDYNALQLQFQRRLSHGLQSLASYTWSHSIDTGSAGSIGVGSNALVPGLGANENRAPSDFDIRSAFSAGITYEIPSPKINAFTNAILHGWSTENFISSRSTPPVDVYDSAFFQGINGFVTNVRADVTPGIPLYLFGAQYPGGKMLNNTPGAVAAGCPDGSQSVGPFCPPPTDSNGNPVRQGNLPRNALRGFRATQWDFAVHRDFPIHEALELQFRAEMFNVLNHPNFSSPVGDISNTAQFGRSIQTLAQGLNNGNLGGGGFSALYQIGGPRSIQLALKLQF